MTKPSPIVHLAALAIAGSALAAQSAAPRFDVATIRQNFNPPPLTLQGPFQMLPGGRFVATAMTLHDLIRMAYAREGVMLGRQQVDGGPSWIRTTRFDIVAQAPDNLDAAGVRAALQSLLTDRFGLTLHHDRKELPVFHLVVSRDDGRLGPDIQPSVCAAAPAGQVTPDVAQQLKMAGVDRPCAPMRFAHGAVLVEGARFAEVGSILANFPEIGRPILDRTRRAEPFDFRLQWFGPGSPEGGIFTALREQLGVELRAATDMLPVVVIDSASMPTEN